MSPESLFKRSQNSVYIRLVLEGWTELPEQETEAWEALTRILKSNSVSRGGAVGDIQQNGDDLHLHLRLDLAQSIEDVVANIRRTLRDPLWQPFIDLERFAWVGDYYAVSVRPEDRLASQPLEHPARGWKRSHLQHCIKRTLEHPWHDAPAPEAVGIEFIACVYSIFAGEACLDLFYHELKTAETEGWADKEAWAAAHLNTRLRISDPGPLLESEGWRYERRVPSLVFRVSSEDLSTPPDSVEVWWVTDKRNRVAVVPCYQAGAEPDFLINGEVAAPAPR